MKHRKTRPSRNTFKIVAIMLLIASIVAASVVLWSYISKTGASDTEEPGNDTIQTFDYSINNYTLFDLDNFEFRFILADIHIESNKPITLSLSHFKTSEAIQLNSVQPYLSSIEQAGYNFGNYSVVSDLISQTTQLDALIFIPIIDDSLESIDLDITLHPVKTLSFDLKKPSNLGIIENLGVNEEIANPASEAEASFVSSTMVGPEQFYQLDANNERIPSSFTSQTQILGVKITVKNPGKNDIKITKAYAHTDTGESYLAIDSSYLIDGVNILAGKDIGTEGTGYLFFEVLGQTLAPENFSSFDLYFSSSSQNDIHLITIKGVQ